MDGRAREFLTVMVLAGCAIAGCSSGGPAQGVAAGQSCAAVVEIDGVQYLGGLGDSALPIIGEALAGHTVGCDDGGGRVADEPVTAHVVSGVAVQDGVAVDGYGLMLAEQWWNRPTSELPPSLRALVRALR